MVIVEKVYGDLLKTKRKYIAQQCNCITCHPHGLSKDIAIEFPYGDLYKTRRKLSNNTSVESDRDEPGTIKILDSNDYNKPKIICIFGQWVPGKINGQWFDKYPLYKSKKETEDLRLEWFTSAIGEIEKQVDSDHEIAVPYKIGCGLAGGDWKKYKKILENSSAKFVVYKLAT